jgi:hypothetical protein
LLIVHTLVILMLIPGRFAVISRLVCGHRAITLRSVMWQITATLNGDGALLSVPGARRGSMTGLNIPSFGNAVVIRQLTYMEPEQPLWNYVLSTAVLMRALTFTS